MRDNEPMSAPSEDINRRLLRARNVMDRRYADPLDLDHLAGVGIMARSHFVRELRRDALALPATTPGRTRHVHAALWRRVGDRDLHGGGFRQPRYVQPHVQRHRRAVTLGVPRHLAGHHRRAGADLLHHALAPPCASAALTRWWPKKDRRTISSATAGGTIDS